MPGSEHYAYRTGQLDFSATVTISSGGTVSTAADLVGFTLVGFRVGTLTGTAITFQASYDGGTTYEQVYNGGSAYSVTVASNKYVTLDPSVFAGVRYVKLVSGSAEGGDRTITLVKAPVL